jgi:hypothetical protein
VVPCISGQTIFLRIAVALKVTLTFQSFVWGGEGWAGLYIVREREQQWGPKSYLALYWYWPQLQIAQAVGTDPVSTHMMIPKGFHRR